MFRFALSIALLVCVAEGLQVAPKKNWVVALDRDMKTKMLVQMKTKQTLAPGLALPKDPCASLECEPLECPGGFTATEAEGHCCPYCVNPELTIDRIITGPTGKYGGKMSVFCKDVMCFPTMCTQAETMPSGHSEATSVAGESMAGGHDEGTVCCPECDGGSGHDPVPYGR